MKNILLIGLLVLSSRVLGCDICGCSSGNYFIGPFPQFNKHFFGVRYSFRNYESVLKTDNEQFSNDLYQTIELWGGLRIGKKWQIFLFAPYNLNHLASDDGVKSEKGFGDITVMSNYRLWTKTSLTKKEKSIDQQLWLGAGVKVPTGKFDVDPDELVASANSQPGTGSVDFLFSTTYTMQLDKWGLNTNVNYKVNTSAKNFQFGNRFNGTLFIFRSFSFSNYTLSPNIGLLYEHLDANKDHNEAIEETGGYAALAAAGLESKFQKVGLGFNVQIPMVQDLSDKQTNTTLRGMVHLTYMF